MMTTATRTAKNKSNRFRLAKKPFARASRFFLLFFPSLHDYDAKLPSLTFFEGRGHQTTNFIFFS